MTMIHINFRYLYIYITFLLFPIVIYRPYILNENEYISR